MDGWMFAGLIAIVVVVVACTGLVVWLTIVTRGPLPALDRRVRRWTLARRVFLLIALAGGAVVVAVLPTGDMIPPQVWGPSIIVTAAGVVLASVAGDKRRETTFAGAHISTGTVTDVIEVPPPSADYSGSSAFLIDAELPGGVTIHRRLNMGGERDPLSWVGKRIQFRHRTLDPADLEDAFFGREERKATLGPSA